MKHGKKYQDVAKLIDRTTQYEPVDAIALVKKTASASLTRQLSATSAQAATAVMPISRSVAPLSFLPAPARPSEFWFSQRAQRSTKHRLQALTMSAAQSFCPGSRMKAGLTLT